MTKNVLITGGTRGIGLGIARELARKGYNLAINGVRNEKDVLSVIEDLSRNGSKIVYCQGDVSLDQDRTGVFEKTIDTFGQVHVLVNNAGVAPENRKDLLETTEESYDRVMNINLKGPFMLTQMVARHMIDIKSTDHDFDGCIINMSSVSADMASTNRGEYCISKAGMGMMTKLFATRLGEYQLPVYEVRPGIIETDMTAGVLDKYKQAVEDGLFIQPRLGTPEDVGKAVTALVEGRFTYSTGQVIMVDGGLSTPRL